MKGKVLIALRYENIPNSYYFICCNAFYYLFPIWSDIGPIWYDLSPSWYVFMPIWYDHSYLFSHIFSTTFNFKYTIELDNNNI